MNDRIHLRGVRVDCRIGVPAEERLVPQGLVIDVSMEKDLGKAARSENVTNTVDYGEVLTVVQELAASREWVLIESLAETMCAEILKRFPVESVRILLKKPEALQERGVEYAAVEMERRRSG